MRFWEKEFKKLQPKTNARGKRAYKQEDIDVIRRIYDLVKVQGLTLEGARKALKARKGESSERGKAAAQAVVQAKQTSASMPAADVQTREEAVTKLKQIRRKLLEARASLQV